MLKKILFLSIILFTLECESLTLNMQDAIEIALQDNAQIKSKIIKAKIKKTKKDASLNVLYPDLTLSIGLNRSATAMGGGAFGSDAIGNQGFSNQLSENPSLIPIYQSLNPNALAPVQKPSETVENDHWSLGFQLNLQFNFNFAYLFLPSINSLQYKIAIEDIESEKQNIISNVKKLFYNALLLQEQILLTEKNIELAKEQFDNKNIAFGSGDVSRLEVLQAEFNYKNSLPDYTKKKNQLKTLKNNIKVILNIPISDDIVIQGSLDIQFRKYTLEEIISLKEDKSDLKNLKMQKSLLQKQKKMTIYQNFTPNFSAGLGYAPTLSGPFNGGNWRSSDKWNAYDGFSFNFGVSMNFAAFLPNSKAWVDIKESEDNLKDIANSIEILNKSTDSSIVEYINNLNDAIDIIEIAQLSQDLAQTVYDQTLLSVNAGYSSILEESEALNKLAQSKLNVLNERINYINSLIELELELGISLQ